MISTEVLGCQSKAMHPFLRIKVPIIEEAIIIIIIASQLWITHMVIKQHLHILSPKLMNHGIKHLNMCHAQHRRVVLGNAFHNLRCIQRVKGGVHIAIAIPRPHVDCVGEANAAELVLHKLRNNVLQWPSV